MTTGDKIARERKKLNLTQEQLAEKLQVTRQSVSRWESDLAYPETENLIKLSEIFSCSVDYLLNKNSTDTTSPTHYPFKFSFEYKSKRELWGMPLVHICIGKKRVAHGVVAIGLVAKGIISIGLLSMGVLSLGVLSLGVFALGTLACGLLSIGVISFGLLVAVGSIAVGALSIGAVAVGLFSEGAFAVGKCVAVGDYAYGNIALGKTVAKGSVFSSTDDITGAFEAIKVSVPKLFQPLANSMLSSFKYLK